MSKLSRFDIIAIARVAHEANLGYCESIGDYSQSRWDSAEQWQRESAIRGVEFALANPKVTPEEQHQAWMQDKLANGWTRGPVKNAELKHHPCLVDYDKLPEEQKVKDALFRAIVKVLVKGV